MKDERVITQGVLIAALNPSAAIYLYVPQKADAGIFEVFFGFSLAAVQLPAAGDAIYVSDLMDNL